MIIYNVFFHKKAAAELKKLAPETRKRVKKKIAELKQHSQRGKPLKHSRFWSLRVGKYRAIYEIIKSKKKIVILYVGHRKSVYSDFSKLF